MLRAFPHVAILFFLFPFAFAGELERVKSDRDVFFLLCDSLVSVMVDSGFQTHRSLSLDLGSDTYTSDFRGTFIEGFTSRGIVLFMQPAAAAATIVLHVGESSVAYGEVFTESLFGRRKAERIVQLTVSGSLIDSTDGRVVWSRKFSRQHRDTVLVADAEKLKAGSPMTSSYSAPALSLFDVLLEPAIVTIASGVVIYLFFTIRS